MILHKMAFSSLVKTTQSQFFHFLRSKKKKKNTWLICTTTQCQLSIISFFSQSRSHLATKNLLRLLLNHFLYKINPLSKITSRQVSHLLVQLISTMYMSEGEKTIPSHFLYAIGNAEYKILKHHSQAQKPFATVQIGI